MDIYLKTIHKLIHRLLQDMSGCYSLGLFGHNIGYSLSPRIHSYWFSLYGIPAEYHLYDIEPIYKNKVLDKLLQQNLHGFNITVPYKEFVFEKLGVKSNRLSAMNTIYRLPDGGIAAANTDVLGGIDIFQSVCDRGQIVILGNGGTARALVEIFFQLKVSFLHIVQRQPKQWHPDYQEMLIFHDWSKAEGLIGDADILINTVPASSLNGNHLTQKTLFCDYTYGTPRSLLWQRARERECDLIPGIEFLLRQAQYSFRYWFDIFPRITPELRGLLLS